MYENVAVFFIQITFAKLNLFTGNWDSVAKASAYTYSWFLDKMIKQQSCICGVKWLQKYANSHTCKSILKIHYVWITIIVLVWFVVFFAVGMFSTV